MAKKPNPVPWGVRGLSRRGQVFATSLKAKRLALGLTQQQMADGTGLTGATVQTAENGVEVTLSTALKLMAFFGVTDPAELWTPIKGGEK